MTVTTGHLHLWLLSSLCLLSLTHALLTPSNELQYNPLLYGGSVTAIGGRDGRIVELDACQSGGNTLRALDLCVDDASITGARVVLSNGDSEVWGSMRCASPARVALRRGERILNLTLTSNARATALCGVRMTTESATHSITARSCTSSARSVRVNIGSGVPCGALGRVAGSRLVALGLYFLAPWHSAAVRLAHLRYSRPPSQPATRAPGVQTWYVYGGTLNNTDSLDGAEWESTVSNVWSGAIMLADVAQWDSSGLLDYAAAYTVQRPPMVNLRIVPSADAYVAQGSVYADAGDVQGPQRLLPWTRTTVDTCPAGCFMQ